MDETATEREPIDWPEFLAALKRPRGLVRMGTRGQLVIPAEMRKYMGLCDGDQLYASIDAEGRLVLARIGPDGLEWLRAQPRAFAGVDPTAWIRALREDDEDPWERIKNEPPPRQR